MGNVVKFKKRNAMAMQCTACGAAGTANCDCGAIYVPANTRAEEAVTNPELANLTNREAATKLGISRMTVQRARKAATVGTNVPTPKRTGKGGKQYNTAKPAKAKAPPPARKPQRITLFSDEPCTDCNTQQEQWHRSLSNMAGEAISLSAYWTQQFGKDWQKFEVSSEVLTLAKQAAEAWNEIVEAMINRKKGK